MPVALHGFYDGTGSPPSRHHGQIIGLAGYAATPEVWSTFEAEWWRVLADDSERPACRALHMADAKALRREFTEERGWTERGVNLLLQALFNRCFSPRGPARAVSDAVVGAACSVEMDAYDRVCDEYPHFADKAPEALCVDHVVTIALKQLVPPDVHGIHLEDLVQRRRSIALFFDRNEPFRHQILRVWEARPWHRRSGALRLVSTIGETDREASAALQAADFLAWHMNRDVASVSGDLQARMMLHFASRCYVQRYDYDELVETAQRWGKDHGYKPVLGPDPE